MQKQPPNVQEAFLNHVRRERINLTIYLVNGAKLTGRIKNFDRFAIILESGGVDQMLFKHAISTISGNRQFGNYMNLDRPGKQDEQNEQKAKRVSPFRPILLFFVCFVHLY